MKKFHPPFILEKSALGLDLSDLSFKIVQLQRKRGKQVITGCLKQDIPDGLVRGGEIKNEQELVDILKSALGKQRKLFTGRRVVCNLPEEKVFVKVIQLPEVERAELGQAVKQEAEANIPLGIKEVCLSWQNIGKSRRKKGHTDVLIAATPRKLADSYVRFLKKSGLEPVALEPESIAVVRSLMTDGDDKPVIVVDVGATGTNFIIYAQSAIRFSSHIQTSGRAFNQAIMQAMKVNETKANELKIEAGLGKDKQDGKVRTILMPLVDVLGKQINSYISFYCSRLGRKTGICGAHSRVLLCGGDSLLLGLPQELNQTTGLRVEMGNPLIHFSNNQRILSQRESLSYTTALGLALGGTS